MTTKLTRRQALEVLSVWGAAPLVVPSLALPQLALGQTALADDSLGQDEYLARPHRYQLNYTYSHDDLVGDLVHGERGDPHREADIPHHEWYTHETRHRFG